MIEASQAIRLQDDQTSAADFRDSVQLAGLADFQDAETSPPRCPQILLILPANETLEIDSPNNVMGLHEIECRKRNSDRRRPAFARDACLRCPNTIPSGVSIPLVAAAVLQTAFVCNEAVTLGSQGIDLKEIGVTAVM